MPITSERMTALINAARAYQSKEIHSNRIIREYFINWQEITVPRFQTVTNLDEAQELFNDVFVGISNLLRELQRPIETDHISVIAREEGHFQARAHANAASKRYMQQMRARRQNAADWEKKRNQNLIAARRDGEDFWFSPCNNCETRADCISREICTEYENRATITDQKPDTITEPEIYTEEEYISQNPNPSPSTFNIGKKSIAD